MGQLIDTASARIQDQMGRDSWSTRSQFGLGIESAGILGGPHCSWEPGPNQLEKLVDPRSTQTRDKSVGIAGRPHSSSDLGQSRAGQLVKPKSFRTRTSVARDSWLTLCQLRHGTESVGIAGGPHSSSDTGVSRLGQLIDLSSDRNPDQVGPNSWLTLCHLGPGTESDGELFHPTDPRIHVSVSR